MFARLVVDVKVVECDVLNLGSSEGHETQSVDATHKSAPPVVRRSLNAVGGVPISTLP
jgi:hypothetical protein